MQLEVHSQSAAVGCVLMNIVADGSPDEKSLGKESMKAIFREAGTVSENENLFYGNHTGGIFIGWSSIQSLSRLPFFKL